MASRSRHILENSTPSAVRMLLKMRQLTRTGCLIGMRAPPHCSGPDVMRIKVQHFLKWLADVPGIFKGRVGVDWDRAPAATLLTFNGRPSAPPGLRVAPGRRCPRRGRIQEVRRDASGGSANGRAQCIVKLIILDKKMGRGARGAHLPEGRLGYPPCIRSPLLHPQPP